MLKSALLLLSLLNGIGAVYAIEYDVAEWEANIKANPTDYRSMLLLGRYYLERDDLNQSRHYLQEAQKIMPEASEAKLLSLRLSKYEEEHQMLHTFGLLPSDPVDRFEAKLQELSFQARHQERNILLNYLLAHEQRLSDEIRMHGVSVMLEEGKIHQARMLFEGLKSKRSAERFDLIEAKLCAQEQNYLCAAEAYGRLFERQGVEQDRLLAAQMYLDAQKEEEAAHLLEAYEGSARLETKREALLSRLEQLRTQKLEAYRAAYEAQSDLAHLRTLCDALHQRKQYQHALEYLNKHEQRFGTSQELELYRADLAFWNADSAEAITHYERIREKDAQTWLKLGRLYSWQGAFAQAHDALDRIESLDPFAQLYYDVQRARAYVWLWSGDYDRARARFEALKEQFPNDTELAQALQEARSRSSSKEPIQTGSSALHKALSLYEKGAYAQSVPLFESDLGLVQSTDTIAQKYAYALQQSGAHEKAAKVYTALYDASPQNRSLAYHAAYNLYQSAQYTEAALRFEQIINSEEAQDSPLFALRHSDLALMYAHTLFETSRFDEAEKLYFSLLYQQEQTLALGPLHVRLLESWKASWQARRLDHYASHYLKPAPAWIEQKKQLFAQNRSIKVDVVAPRIISQDLSLNRFTLRFWQEYRALQRTDSGFKELVLVCDATACVIEHESWYALEAKRTPIVAAALEGIRRLGRAKTQISVTQNEAQTVVPPQEVPINLYREDPIARRANELEALSTPVQDAAPLQVSQPTTAQVQPNTLKHPVDLGLNAQYYADSDALSFQSGDVMGRVNVYDPLKLIVGVGLFKLQKKRFGQTEWIEGIMGHIGLEYGSWSGGLILDSYQERNAYGPYVGYHGVYDGFLDGLGPIRNTYNVKLYQRNLYASKYTLAALDKGIEKYALRLSNTIDWIGTGTLWGALEWAYINDDNYLFNVMFDWRFVQMHGRYLDTDVMFSGWYERLSGSSRDYYTPKGDDAHFLLFKPAYRLGSDLSLAATLGFGLSMRYEQWMARYGLHLQSAIGAPFKFKAGCVRNEPIDEVHGMGAIGYDYTDCVLNLLYRW